MADADYSRIAAAMVPAQAMQYPYPSLVDALAATHPPEEPGWLERQRRRVAPYVEPLVGWQNEAMGNAPQSFQRLADAFSESPRLNPLVDAPLSVGEGVEHLNDLQRRWEAERQLGLPQQAPPDRGFAGRTWDMMSGDSDLSMPLVGMMGGGRGEGLNWFGPKFKQSMMGESPEDVAAFTKHIEANPITEHGDYLVKREINPETGGAEYSVIQKSTHSDIGGASVDLNRGPRVTSSFVNEDMRRKGIGTLLYNAMDADLGKVGRRLFPDDTLSPEATEFWKNRRPSALKNHEIDESGAGRTGNILYGMLPAGGPSGLGPEAEAATAAKLGANEGNLTLYHGNPNDITKFDRHSWLTPDYDLAHQYRGGSMADISKPITGNVYTVKNADPSRFARPDAETAARYENAMYDPAQRAKLVDELKAKGKIGYYFEDPASGNKPVYVLTDPESLAIAEKNGRPIRK